MNEATDKRVENVGKTVSKLEVIVMAVMNRKVSEKNNKSPESWVLSLIYD